MYVCICNRHRSSDIREAAATGLTEVREVYAHLGTSVRCGCCLDYAKKLINDVQATQPPQPRRFEPKKVLTQHVA